LKRFAGFPLGTSKNADAKILNREPVWVDDFGTLPKLDSQLIASLPADVRRWRELTNRYFQAWLAVPLVVADQVYGSMAFYYNTPTTFDQDEIALSQSFADQAALAIENAQLYQEIERASSAAERNRLARDLHDAVTQTLFSASMIADVLPKIWERDPVEGQRRLGELRQLTRGALSEMRTLLVELRPTALADTDLRDLLTHQVNAFIARTGLSVTFNCQCSDNPPVEAKEMFYRIAQEALNNIAKHAGAANVKIVLTCTSDKTILIIKDDGMGFDLDLSEGEGLGLGIMRERARNAGAQFIIISRFGQGTCLEAHWPAPNTEEH
jgi:signal transduction histidine kinase